MAQRTGLEPATPGVTGRYSNRLNYRSEEAFIKLAERTGLEPATPGVTGRYSNQLNYRSAAAKSTCATHCLSGQLGKTCQGELASPRGFEPLYSP